MGKGIDKMVKNAATKATGGCVKTLFKHAADYRTSQTKRRDRRSASTALADQAHTAYQRTGKIPFWVQNFVRDGHHLNLASA